MDTKISNNIEKTFKLLDNSYSPYSNFRVASSIITKQNTFYGGVNIENASYSLTACAERSAICNAFSNGLQKEDIDYIIIVSDCTKKLLPCGACLQVFSEFINKDTIIIIACFDKSKNNKFIRNDYKFKDLLPNVFNL
jgi:cytidine deaminase